MPKFEERDVDNVTKAAAQVNNSIVGVVDFAKSKVFDVIGIVILAGVVVFTLGVFDKRLLSFEEFINIILEVIPIFVAAMMLSINYYNKGVYKGKATAVYLTAVSAYSEIVEKFTGALLIYLTEFCDNYNDKEKIRHQRLILKSISVTYEEFAEGTENRKPLVQMNKKELREYYNDDCIKVIQKAKNVHIKGISDNRLLGNLNTNDNTDVGPNEKELRNSHTVMWAIFHLIAIVIFSLLTIKNILEWGWLGLLLMSYKIVYVAVRSYMRYFEGYNDMTVRMINHYNRKSDILKQCLYEYDKIK